MKATQRLQEFGQSLWSVASQNPDRSARNQRPDAHLQRGHELLCEPGMPLEPWLIARRRVGQRTEAGRLSDDQDAGRCMSA